MTLLFVTFVSWSPQSRIPFSRQTFPHPIAGFTWLVLPQVHTIHARNVAHHHLFWGMRYEGACCSRLSGTNESS